MEETIWSGTDFPYACLIDEYRTKTFQAAIEQTVKPGDLVVDIGSGSGILAFFAAKAGATQVYAVEIDHLLAESLKKSIWANGFEDKITVVEGNALSVSLPQNANVVIAEIIETGLLDEMQLQVINELRTKGVISAVTRIIPGSYESFIRLADVDNNFYGFKVMAPIHDWPFYSNDGNNLHRLKKTFLSEKKSLGRFDFEAAPVPASVSRTISFKIDAGQKVNAVELSGVATLGSGFELGATNAFNGNKFILIDEITGPKEFNLHVSYEMGQGLGNLKLKAE